jgi:hypothetical protein
MTVLLPLLDTLPFSVTYDSANQWLYVQWRDKQDAISSLASFSLLRRFIATTRVPKLLCDSSQALDGWDGIGDWVSKQYLPSLAELGVCSIAWVTAHDWVTKDHILQSMRETRVPSVVTYEDLAEAYNWLQKTTFPCYS